MAKELTKYDQGLLETGNEQRAAFLRFLKETRSVSAAAELVGVSRARAYQWRKHSEFREEWNDTVMGFIDEIESVGIQRALDGDPTMIRFFLQSWKTEQYSIDAAVRLRLEGEPHGHRYINFSGDEPHAEAQNDTG